MANPPAIFFVPGAWHQPWVFDGVRSTLSNRGFETDTSALATVGSMNASVGVLDDAAVIRSALLGLIEAGKEVVVVAHSYGGVVASNSVQDLSISQRTADGKAGGITLLLYLCAFVVPVETSLLMALNNVFPDWWNVTEDRQFITPIDPSNVFYADVKPPLAAKAVAALEPMPFQMAIDKSTYAPFNEAFEVGYIFTEKDQALDVGAQRGMFSQFPAGSFSASLDSSHSPFLSMPVTLADIIQDAINHVRGKNVH
ncbi:hypothetical protein F4821DRAFT_261600 [Hypoxylon rubiginosum]|uniref:Uncharacterized protein n=1 Tax=Hypoxylon rubiginosum TaxID=110542 RepID=A0ACC0CW82_9PEZI|nr:hypothetical protein F4821DRAFT_261600 [Hypoxylon rubiginosum]